MLRLHVLQKKTQQKPLQDMAFFRRDFVFFFFKLSYIRFSMFRKWSQLVYAGDVSVHKESEVICEGVRREKTIFEGLLEYGLMHVILATIR